MEQAVPTVFVDLAGPAERDPMAQRMVASSRSRSADAAAPLPSLRPSAMEASVGQTAAEYYGALLRREQEDRRVLEERLAKERLAVMQAQSEQRSQMKEFDEERNELLQKIGEKDQMLDFEKMVLTSQMEQERKSARGQQQRLRERVKQHTMCQRSLLKEVSTLLAEREALKKELARTDPARFGLQSHCFSRSTSSPEYFPNTPRSQRSQDGVGLDAIDDLAVSELPSQKAMLRVPPLQMMRSQSGTSPEVGALAAAAAAIATAESLQSPRSFGADGPPSSARTRAVLDHLRDNRTESRQALQAEAHPLPSVLPDDGCCFGASPSSGSESPNTVRLLSAPLDTGAPALRSPSDRSRHGSDSGVLTSFCRDSAAVSDSELDQCKLYSSPPSPSSSAMSPVTAKLTAKSSSVSSKSAVGLSRASSASVSKAERAAYVRHMQAYARRIRQK